MRSDKSDNFSNFSRGGTGRKRIYIVDYWDIYLHIPVSVYKEVEKTVTFVTKSR